MAVVGIIVGVGITLFLLPPVPGAPIYVTAGIVIPAVAKDQIGLGMCIVFALALSLFNKLFAHFLQPCVIGTFLGNKLYVRQTCQVRLRVCRSSRRFISLTPPPPSPLALRSTPS